MAIDDDIRTLVESLDNHHVYKIHPGRRFDPDDLPPRDVITEGYRRLAHGSNRTIDHYNKYFKNLQRRFKVSPVSTMIAQPESTPSVPSAPTDTVTAPETGGACEMDRTADGPQESEEHDSITGDAFPISQEDEDNVCALFDWDGIEDAIEAELSEEEDFVDDESESDAEL
ncbi:hypothetical protein FRC12_005156 [Ceratobasidium sp. 428]|nr:hypothetical protein FRC12_005156 [Ceratobasidium sp. 428]